MEEDILEKKTCKDCNDTDEIPTMKGEMEYIKAQHEIPQKRFEGTVKSDHDRPTGCPKKSVTQNKKK